MDLQRHHCRKVRESTHEWRRRRTRTVLVLLRWPQEEKVEEKPCLARGLASLALGIAYPGHFKKRGGEGTSERTQSTRRNMMRKSLVLLLFSTTETQDHRNTGPQKHRTTETQDHRNTRSQKHRTTETQDPSSHTKCFEILIFAAKFLKFLGF